MEENKICINCKEVKKLNDFWNRSTSKDGKNSYCKICSKNSKNRLISKAEEKRIQINVTKGQICITCEKFKSCDEFYFRKDNNTYKSECKECVIIRSNQNYNKNKKNILEKQKNKNQDLNQIEKNKIKNKKWYLHNKEKISQQNKNYYILNKDKIIKRNNKYQENKIKNNIEYRLRKRISRAVNNMINGAKKESILNYLQYSIFELKEYLELQFEYWMSWENNKPYSVKTWDDDNFETWVWHIDHIIPHSELPYDSMEHINFKRSWCLLNLRPLSGKINNIDGSTKVRHDKNLKFDEFGNPIFQNEDKKKLLEKIDNWIKERENKI